MWPSAPQKGRLQHIETLTGFRETGGSVRTAIFGKEEVKFRRPVEVATAADGRIAVADPGCRCVHLYIPSEAKYKELSAVNDTEMVSPVSVVFGDQSRLYVSDSARREVMVFDKEGNFLYHIKEAFMVGLKRPTGLAYNSARKLLYVVDTLENKVYAFRNRDAVFVFGGRGTKGGDFNFPTNIFWTEPGKIYVTDAMNFRVEIFNSSGGFLASVGHHGDGSGDFSMPKGVAADKRGIIYVVDRLFDNVQLFNEQGEFLLTLGSRGTGGGEFWLPSGIFIDGSDRLYVCDTYNQRIQVFQILGNGSEPERTEEH
ncbi:MAG: 6-bladed beta-propeller [Candidatus Sulfobium sp.]